jgi:hypothetical protein
VQPPFAIRFANGRIGTGIRVEDADELPRALAALGLNGRPTLVLVGGADGLSADDEEKLRPLFVETLAPLLDELGAQVVDGGTDAGVMRLIGVARAEQGLEFPLVGVAGDGNVAVPGSPASAGAAELEPNHSHFVLVPGDAWGDESPWIARVATALADGRPSVTLLVNGGEVAWRDASQSVAESRTVVAVAGSGRAADEVVAHLSGVRADPRADLLTQSGLLVATEAADGGASVGEAVRRLLGGDS